MRIDVHNHIFPKKLVALLEKRGHYPYARTQDGALRLHCCEGLAIPNFPSFDSPENKLADMDRVGIDVCILSINLPGPELAGGHDADELARVANDCVAGYVTTNPKRFWGMASLGYGDIDASLKELDRCFNELKFRGLQIFSNINGRTLDDPSLRPIFARMAELKRPMFMHPSCPLNRSHLMELVPVPALAFIYDTTLAAARLALSGMIRKYHDCPIIIPHVGGAIPYLMTRIAEMVTSQYGGSEKEKDPVGAMKALYMDTVAYDPAPLKWCLETMGAEHLLFGSDHPHAGWHRPVEAMNQINCSNEERELMTHGNAERLFRP
ncbi:MAG: amidohydrolase family protein [Candidatus Binataceae bacterium]